MKNIDGKLAIFAGRGKLPQILIDDCVKNNVDFQVFLLASEEYEENYSKYNPVSLYYGQVGKFLEELESKQIKNLVFIGGVTKPNFKQIKVDKKAAVLIAKIVANKILGDDAVLSTVVKFFEKQGLKVWQINELLEGILAKKSVLTKKKPDAEDLNNIKIANKAIEAFSKFDVGQAVIVSQKQIIAVEALEGTDEMIKRCKDLNVEYKEDAVLVKMKKKGQSSKADLPTIGINTIENCHKSKIKGLAIQAEKTLIIEKEKVIAKANEYGIFIVAT